MKRPAIQATLEDLAVRVAASSAAPLLSLAKDWGWLPVFAITIPKAFGLEAATRKLLWDVEN